MPIAHRTDTASRDLGEIAFQIGIESSRPRAADRIIDELIDCCDHLASLSPMSRLGTAAEELGEGIRLFHHRRWVVIFRYVDDGILVLRIVDGSQDYLAWKLSDG